MVKSRPEILTFFEKPRLVDSTFFRLFLFLARDRALTVHGPSSRPESSGALFRFAVRPCIFALCWDSSEIPKDSKGLLSAWVAGPDSLVHQRKQVGFLSSCRVVDGVERALSPGRRWRSGDCEFLL